MFLTAHCLDVEFTGTQHHMQIDLTSVEALELIKPLAAGASKKGNSLYRYSVIAPRVILTVNPRKSAVCTMPVPHLSWGVSQCRKLGISVLIGLRLLLMCRFLNHTKTRGGARLLRANLLQPLTSLDTVRMRQDAIQELVSNDDLAFTLGQGLSQMPKDLDRYAV